MVNDRIDTFRIQSVQFGNGDFMKKKYLVVIDMQNDFVTGVLGTKEARDIIDNVRSKVDSFDGEVIFTQDTHDSNYLNTQEGHFLPVTHCVKPSEGWKIIPQLQRLIDARHFTVIEKPSFGSLELSKLIHDINNKDSIESIELVGVCTDICVLSNAAILKATVPEVPVFVSSSCCAGVTKELHDSALKIMESIQVNII